MFNPCRITSSYRAGEEQRARLRLYSFCVKGYRGRARPTQPQRWSLNLQSQELCCMLCRAKDQLFHWGVRAYADREDYCNVMFLPLFSGILSSSVSLSGLMQTPCMVRSCHPIILRCIPMMCRSLGKSRSLQDMAFAFISHIWTLNHRRTASMTL